MTGGGYFIQRPETELFDTPLSAQSILRSMVQAHGKRLASMPVKTGSVPQGAVKAGGSLLDLVNAGLASDNNVRIRRCFSRSGVP